MAGKKRDYKAEYARRVALAKERGFSNYYQQRRKIESGQVPAINPNRLRKRSTIEAQEKFPTRGKAKTQAEWWESVNIQDARIDMARRWSDWYSRDYTTQFDADRAKHDERYLTVYMQAFVLAPHSDSNVHHLDGDTWQYEWFVDLNGFYDAEEFEDKYPPS
jgi:hypothetical protein